MVLRKIQLPPQSVIIRLAEDEYRVSLALAMDLEVDQALVTQSYTATSITCGLFRPSDLLALSASFEMYAQGVCGRTTKCMFDFSSAKSLLMVMSCSHRL